MELTIKNKSQLIFIGLLIWLCFLISKKITTYYENKIRYSKEEIKKNKQLINTIENIEKLKKQEEPFRNIGWDTKEMVAVMGKINSIAAKHNIQIISFDPAGTSKVENCYQVFNMNMELKAEYFDLLRFISELENLNMLTKISSLKINPEEANFQENSLLRGSLSIEAYALL